MCTKLHGGNILEDIVNHGNSKNFTSHNIARSSEKN
jgi:hypothetical protein